MCLLLTTLKKGTLRLCTKEEGKVEEKKFQMLELKNDYMNQLIWTPGSLKIIISKTLDPVTIFKVQRCSNLHLGNIYSPPLSKNNTFGTVSSLPISAKNLKGKKIKQ